MQIQVQYYVTVNAGALDGNNETGYFFGHVHGADADQLRLEVDHDLCP